MNPTSGGRRQRDHAGWARADRHGATDAVHLLRDRAGKARGRQHRSRGTREAGTFERHRLIEDEVRRQIERQHRPHRERRRRVGVEEGLDPVVQVDPRGSPAQQHDQRRRVVGIVDGQELRSRHADRGRVADVDLDTAHLAGAEGVDVRHQGGDDVDLSAGGTRGERRHCGRGRGGDRGGGRRGGRRGGTAGRRRARGRGRGRGGRGGGCAAGGGGRRRSGAAGRGRAGGRRRRGRGRGGRGAWRGRGGRRAAGRGGRRAAGRGGRRGRESGGGGAGRRGGAGKARGGGSGRKGHGRRGGRGRRTHEDLPVDGVELCQERVAQGRLRAGVQAGGAAALRDQLRGRSIVLAGRRAAARGFVERLALERRVRRLGAALADRAPELREVIADAVGALEP